MQTGSIYTADEIIAIIDKAREAGMSAVKIPGFEGAFAKPLVLTQPSQAPKRTDADLEDYRYPFGKYMGRGFSEVPIGNVKGYMEWLLQGAEFEGLSAKAQECVEKSQRWLKRA